ELGQAIIYSTPDQLEAMSMADHLAILNKGVVEQIGDPETIYGKPKNRYVASMIGSPAMNFLEGTWEASDTEAYLNCGDFKIKLTKFKEPIEKDSTSSELTFGIRPEHIKVNHEKISPESVQANVIMEEPLGSETILHLNINEELVKAIVPPTFQTKYGEKLWMDFDMDRIHVLDTKTENVII
ncbi:TOBE domain-containing protein, partial [[Eubacterium] cellulosolvens]